MNKNIKKCISKIRFCILRFYLFDKTSYYLEFRGGSVLNRFFIRFPYIHFLKFGKKIRFKDFIIQKPIREYYKIIKKSHLIDYEYSFFYKQNLINEITRSFCFYLPNYCGARKPFPDFDPGIFSEKLQIGSKSPLGEFVRLKKPKGPWLKNVLRPCREWRRKPLRLKAALHIHAYYPNEVSKIIYKLKFIKSYFDIYISCNSESDINILKSRWSDSHHPTFFQKFPNRGRDIGPLLTGFRDVFSNYEIIGHLHTKKTPQADSSDVERWVNYLLENLLCSQKSKFPIVENILNRFNDDSHVGLIYPSIPYIMTSDSCIEPMRHLLHQLNIPYQIPKYISFPMGTMFWARREVLDPLFSLNLSFDQYPEEPLPLDGTMLHAIERIFPILSEHHGFKTVVTHTPGVIF